MQYESKGAVTFNGNEACPSVNNKICSPRNAPAPMKKFMLNKVIPVAAHIFSLLIGLGIVIIFSHFVE